METTVLERIKAFLVKVNLTDNQFAKAINVPQTTVSGMFVRGGDPKTSLINSIIDVFPDLRAEWLLRGEGAMFKSEENHRVNEEENIGIGELMQIVRNFQNEIMKRDAEIDRLRNELNELKNGK